MSIPTSTGILRPGLGLLALALYATMAPQPAVAADGQLVKDKGRLRILLEGREVGTEEFEITQDGDTWVASGNAEVKGPDGSTMKVRGEMKLAADAAPVSYGWSTENPKASATITFQDGAAHMELRMEGATPYNQSFFFQNPRVAILDNNLYHHYAVLAALYDWNAGGVQNFPVLIPQDLTPGTITVESAGSAAEGGGQVLRVRTADLELEVVVDQQRRLQRISVPAVKAEIVRQ